MYKIAFLDDGIMNGAENLPQEVRKYVVNNGQISIRKEDESQYILSHGTMCFWIFAEYILNTDYILYDIQILNEYTDKGNMEDLLQALQFCYDEKIDLINMSLGSTHFINEEGNSILEKLYNQGTYMVAAQNNDNLVTYPACTPYVFGVVRDYTQSLKVNEFCYVNDQSEKIDIISHCDFSAIELKHDIIMGKHNSFCAPYVSALIFNQLQNGGKREDILYYFMKHSLPDNSFDKWKYKKRSFPVWKDMIDVPVIDMRLSDKKPLDYLISLVEEFREDSFHAVGIWIGNKGTDDKAYLFQFPQREAPYEEQILKWVFNATDPDIIICGYDYISNSNIIDLVDLTLTDQTSEEKKLSPTINVHKKSISQVVESIGRYFG